MDNYEDVSNFLTFSDDEDGMHDEHMIKDTAKRNNGTPLSPPASAEGDAIDEDEYDDDDDLYSCNPATAGSWKTAKPETGSPMDSQVNPLWLHSESVPRLQQHPSPAMSDEGRLERRTVLDTIQERNDSLVKTGATAKSSKSFPLLPDLLKLKQAEDEDEKILASEEGKKLNPRERRQLRNKVSARNFRVRRKGNPSSSDSD
jgi:hypothetical protein